jgi:DNA polymerase-3 subunit chi
MSQVVFYLLADGDDRASFTCELIERAYQKGRKLFVQCDSQHDAEQMDNLLWGFKPESFIPHNIQGESPLPPPPVQMGYTDKAQGFYDILINFSATIPPFHEQFKHIVELVDANPENKIRLRTQYREYQALGHQVRSQSKKTPEPN